ncbi:hypothetical protein Y1Q_0009350 [Alligator mississippiensis]|uniref:Uncharacterized protein n=1 Tax=Alligator mississippiensis TaxID=8496 RepID=A0A151N895_ALLMI|nr:hypothetical protein Y1Q_0009350 [Alligator mississippiensis]
MQLFNLCSPCLNRSEYKSLLSKTEWPTEDSSTGSPKTPDLERGLGFDDLLRSLSAGRRKSSLPQNEALKREIRSLAVRM